MYTSIKLFKPKAFVHGSADIVDICNLHCSHCYWWKTKRNEKTELIVEDWRNLIRNSLKKLYVNVVTLVGGDPLMREDIVRSFCDEMPWECAW